MAPAAENNVADMDPAATANKIGQHRDVIVGIKTAHLGFPGWAAIKNVVEAGRLSGITPVMVDDHIFTNSGRTSREKLLEMLRPGDMHTHSFNDRQIELIDRFSGKVQPSREGCLASCHVLLGTRPRRRQLAGSVGAAGPWRKASPAVSISTDPGR